MKEAGVDSLSPAAERKFLPIGCGTLFAITRLTEQIQWLRYRSPLPTRSGLESANRHHTLNYGHIRRTTRTASFDHTETQTARAFSISSIITQPPEDH